MFPEEKKSNSKAVSVIIAVLFIAMVIGGLTWLYVRTNNTTVTETPATTSQAPTTSTDPVLTSTSTITTTLSDLDNQLAQMDSDLSTTDDTSPTL